MKYDFDDILLQPGITTLPESRSDIFPYDENGMLPLFTAPMLDVAGTPKSQAQFLHNRIYVIKPRKSDPTKGELKSTSSSFVAVGMDDFRKYFCKGYAGDPEFVVIDIANGHQEQLLDLIHKTKNVCHNTKIMVGNIANPLTYVELSNAGADFVRLGIGNGCFVPEMEVMTTEGLKKIQDVILGDKVKTHTGEFCEVLETHIYERNEELIIINDEIKCTDNHEFYVIKKEDENRVTEENIHDYALWIPAKKLNDTYLLVEMD